jgi:hypothetical protein
MTDPIQALLRAGALKTSAFPSTSRYSGIETTTLVTVDGKTVVYLRRRVIPPPERFALLLEHAVSQGERLDLLAAQYLGDPEQFWRICDANAAMRPDELVEVIGRRLRITLPEGFPGAQGG